MTYNPNTGIASNKAQALVGIPIDHRTWKQTGPEDNENNIYRPFNSEAEILAYFDTPEKRKGGFEIHLLSNGKIIKYSFIDTELKPIIGGEFIETNLNEINNKITQNSTSITQNAYQIALKANQTEVNTLTNRVTQHDASFIVTAQQIASKVSQQDFNSLGQRVSNAETSITQTANQIQLKASQQSVNELTGRISAAETSITQTSHQIALKADKTDYTAINNKLAEHSAQLTINAQQIASKVSQADLNDLGERITQAETSIIQTANQIALKADKSVVDSLTNTVNDNTAELLILSDEIATKVSSSVTDALGERIDSAETSINQTSSQIALKADKDTVDTLSNRVTTNEGTLTVQADQIASKVSQTDFNNLGGRVSTTESKITQLEGDITSVVTQSEFDALDSRVSSTESSISQQAGQIASKVSQGTFDALGARVTTAESAITQNTNNINLKVSQSDFNGTNLVSQINLAPDNIKIQSKNINIDGILTVTSADTQARIENLQIGGRNLLIDSSFENGTLLPVDFHDCTPTIGTKEGIQPIFGKKYLILDSGPSGGDVYTYFNNLISVTGGDSYAISFYMASDNLSGISGGSSYIEWITQSGSQFQLIDHQATSLARSWRRFSIVVTAPIDATSLRLRFGIVLPNYGWLVIDNIKLEKGNKATDWTPAPEDVEADATAKANAVDAKIGSLPAGKTIITGGKITTDLIATDTLIARQVQTSGTNNITLNQNDDNQLKFRHPGGGVGIQMGIIDGALKLVFYDTNGNKVWEAGQQGLVYVTVVPESWSTVTYVTVSLGGSYPPTPAQISTMGNSSAVRNMQCLTQDGQFIGIKGGTDYYRYEPGNTNSANDMYRGIHTTQQKEINNFIADGYYIQQGIANTYVVGENVNIDIVYIQNGIEIGGATLNVNPNINNTCPF